MDEQNDFGSVHSGMDGIFTLKQTIEKIMARSMNTHQVFVNPHKAYDTAPLNKLWTSIINNDVCKTYVKASKNFLTGCTSSVKVGENIAPEFEATTGLCQGCTLDPTLCKIYLEEALRDWKDECY